MAVMRCTKATSWVSAALSAWTEFTEAHPGSAAAFSRPSIHTPESTEGSMASASAPHISPEPLPLVGSQEPAGGAGAWRCRGRVCGFQHTERETWELGRG